jgi:hypothetical protein
MRDTLLGVRRLERLSYYEYYDKTFITHFGDSSGDSDVCLCPVSAKHQRKSETQRPSVGLYPTSDFAHHLFGGSVFDYTLCTVRAENETRGAAHGAGRATVGAYCKGVGEIGWICRLTFPRSTRRLRLSVRLRGSHPKSGGARVTVVRRLMRIVKTLVILAVAVAAVGVLALAVRSGSLSQRRELAAREYKAQGFQMVDGCNGGAAVEAAGQVFTIKQYLEDFTDSPAKDTNIIVQLQTALVIAQEKAKVLNDDCRRRGHCDTCPWKTNWATIKKALAGAEKEMSK